MADATAAGIDLAADSGAVLGEIRQRASALRKPSAGQGVSGEDRQRRFFIGFDTGLVLTVGRGLGKRSPHLRNHRQMSTSTTSKNHGSR